MPELRFNPTASVIQHTGSNREEIEEFFRRHGVTMATEEILGISDYAVVFMGEARRMTEQQFRSAQGLV